MIVQCPFVGISITSDATQDVWSLMMGSGRQSRLLAWEITSSDIAAEAMQFALKRITAVGSGGSAATEVKLLEGDEATINGSVRTGDTTPGTAGDILAGYEWEQVGPLREVYIPEMRPVIGATDGIALVCNSAVAFTMSGFVCWEE